MSSASPIEQESGFTLFEVLIVMVLAIIVVGVPLTLSVVAFRDQNVSASRSATASRAQIGVDRMTRDMRQAVSAAITSGSAPAMMVLQVPTRRANNSLAAPPPTTVSWSCVPAGVCTRSTSTGDVRQLIPGVVSATFSPTTLPGATQMGRIDVDVAVRVLSEDKQLTESVPGTGTVAFHAGVDLRNLG